jgi:ribosomal protein S14
MKKNYIFNLQKRKLLKEYVYRDGFYRIADDYFMLKIIVKSKLVSKQTKALAVFHIAFLCSTFSKTKQKNVCLRGGYKRSVINHFGLNRCFAREIIGDSFFPGYSPAK